MAKKEKKKSEDISTGMLNSIMGFSKKYLTKNAFKRFISSSKKPSKSPKKTGHWKDALKEYIKVRPAPIQGDKDRPRVNDKCPYCNSGKKFKKCCMP